ncbi:DNA-directed RNA polymerase II [Coprinopsis cinerea AmutBmut pab1-1]|nr:DNA-directed RNA polymerase II [Coprinopsis cinerea AmutBmut pab1-1]
MTETTPKIKILKGAAPDLSAATYQLHDESHTMGNSLRWMLMKNPKVEFCGYSNPHPSENVINVRIQMYGAYRQTLESLVHSDMCFRWPVLFGCPFKSLERPGQPMRSRRRCLLGELTGRKV